MTTVHEAWSDVMRDVREIRKSERNKQQGFNFRGIDAVQNAVGPIFRQHGVSCVPSRIVDAKHRDFTSKSGALMHEAIITVEYRVTGPEGDFFTGEAIGESSDASDKATTQAMSVALRTFLLQGLTMPTDDQDPDHNTVDRTDRDGSTQSPIDEWGGAENRKEAWVGLTDRAKKLGDDGKAELREWLKVEGITASTMTKDQANAYHRKLKSFEDSAASATGAKDLGWRSAAERTKTLDSLIERVGKLPAYEAEVVDAVRLSLGITDDINAVTKAQATEWLSAIEEAEKMARNEGS